MNGIKYIETYEQWQELTNDQKDFYIFIAFKLNSSDTRLKRFLIGAAGGAAFVLFAVLVGLYPELLKLFIKLI